MSSKHISCYSLLLCMILTACSIDKQNAVSEISADDNLIFFRTAAWQKQGLWHIPIHGWVYKPQNSKVRKKAFAEILKKKFNLAVNATNNKYFSERTNIIIADNERNREIVIRLAGKTYILPASEPNGHFQQVIQLKSSDVSKYATNNTLSFEAITKSGETRRFTGTAMLVPPTGISVISDIDDTIKLSHVTNRKKLLEYTFLREFAAAPGMVNLYRNWANHNTAFHYVSSSPWQLYPPLRNFVDRDGFPKATFSLKYVRFRDETFFNLFKKGTETKPAQIEPILKRFPKRKFVLVGDSGEQDPEVYAGIYNKYPEQIAKIYIRNVTGAKSSDARFRNTFRGIDPSHWTLFNNPNQIGDQPGASLKTGLSANNQFYTYQ